MDGFSLERAALSDPVLKRYYIGVFSADTVPPIQKNMAFFVNTSKSTDFGQHWIAGHSLREDGVFEFLCSFGSKLSEFPLVEKGVKEYTDKKVYTFPRPVQVSWSSSCGGFVLFFLFFCARKMYGAEILKSFFTPAPSPQQLYKFDIFVLNIITTLYKLSFTPAQLLLDIDFLIKHKQDEKEQKIIKSRKW